MLNRIRDFWDNVRRIFFLIVMLIGIAVLSIVLLDPTSLVNFVNSINAILRVLFLLALYGGFGFYAYTVLSGRRQEKGIDGLVSRKGGNVSGVSVEIVQSQLHKAIHDMGGIKHLDVDVSERRGKADIRVVVIFEQQNINIVQKQTEIRRKIDQIVRKQLGISYLDEPIISLNAQGGSTPKSQPKFDQKAPTPVTTSDDDDNNPEWQAIMRAAQQPDDKQGGA
ncbi:MAG: hypothetical protein CUN52_12800 [Phototrophicales bacterium]|nr:MAG: hypothetical protein CUN52_12800 [Phototrophicales bacterium]